MPPIKPNRLACQYPAIDCAAKVQLDSVDGCEKFRNEIEAEGTRALEHTLPSRCAALELGAVEDARGCALRRR